MAEIYKTVRTVTKVVEAEEILHEKPAFGVGDYVEVYSGRYEGHHFVIKSIRYNHDIRQFEYLYGDMLMGGWYLANSLAIIRRAAEREKDKERAS